MKGFTEINHCDKKRDHSGGELFVCQNKINDGRLNPFPKSLATLSLIMHEKTPVGTVEGV